MKFRDAIERSIYAAAYVAEFNRLHDMGVHAEFRRRVEIGTLKQEHIVREWEAWCADSAVDEAQALVSLYRQAQRRAR